MARMLKAISLLLIGGVIGVLAAGSGGPAVPDDRHDRSAATATPAPVATATIAFDTGSIPRAGASQQAHVRAHQALSARIAEESETARQRPMGSRRIRVAQAGGRMSDAAQSLPLVMRPLPVRTRGGENAAPAARSAAETRLIEAIQKELKRVGCYSGDIDSDWGHETRRAMRAFNDRVNATLPIDRPDYILLTLLQGHAAKACGAACPPGQDLSDGGKCLPRSVIAEERRRLAAERAEASSAPRAAVAMTGAAAPQAETRQTVQAPREAPSHRADRAEVERQRIAAAEARRKQKLAEIEARQETERRARVAAAEKARVAAEARRREEIAALAARAAKRAAAAAQPAAPDRAPVTTGTIAPSTPPPLPVQRSSPPESGQQVAAPRDSLQVEAASPVRRRAARRHRERKPRGARFVGQFMPPPTYRVGRLPARASGVRIFGYAARPTSRRTYNPQRIFRDLLYAMP